MQKSSGSYYTPDTLADFLISKVAGHFKGKNGIRILEPSCGDGSFLKALSRSAFEGRSVIEAVELKTSTIKKAKAPQKTRSEVTFHNEDFLHFRSTKTYDLVIGNPPYIKRKLLKLRQKERCRQIHNVAGLLNRAISNIWTAFLIKSAQHLSSDGVLAFVLPAELLQVKFAQEIQSFLKRHFQRIEIYSFREMAFDNLGQDTIALIAYRKAVEPGVYFGQVANLALASKSDHLLTRSKSVETSDIKWAGHILSDDDADFLIGIASRLHPISHYCNSCAGIVTAANKFFVVSKQIRKQFDLNAISKPIIQRGQFVNGTIVFDSVAFKKIKNEGKPCYLLDVTGKKLKNLSKGARKYITSGRSEGIQERYKCEKRKRWYDVPSVWSSHAFFFKRCHLYPKLLLNDAKVLVTDAAYRISVKEGFCVRSLIFSFYNSLTLAMAELRGRFYGGGVLEVTPNEFKSLPIPYVEIADTDFLEFEERFDRAESIEHTLQTNDAIILKGCLDLNSDEIGMLQSIRKKLVSRRLRETA